MKKLLFILTILFLIFSFSLSKAYSLEGKIVGIDKNSQTILVSEEPKFNFFQRILNFFGFIDPELNVYQIPLHNSTLTQVTGGIFNKQEVPIDVSNIFIGQSIKASGDVQIKADSQNIGLFNSQSAKVSDVKIKEPFSFKLFDFSNTTKEVVQDTPATYAPSQSQSPSYSQEPSQTNTNYCQQDSDCIFCNGKCVLSKTASSNCNTIPIPGFICQCYLGKCNAYPSTQSQQNNVNDFVSQDSDKCTTKEELEKRDPVCGTDNRTYLNECYALRVAKVQVACKGECPCSNENKTTSSSSTTSTSTSTSTTTSTSTSTTTTTIPKTIKTQCINIGGGWLEEYQECEKADASNISEFKNWCEDNDGIFNMCASPCRHENTEYCVTMCMAICSFDSSLIGKKPPTSSSTTTTTKATTTTTKATTTTTKTTTTTTKPTTTTTKPTTTTTKPTTTTKSTGYHYPTGYDCYCDIKSDCNRFDNQMCPEMEGVQCYYDCIGHKCEWVIDMPNTSQIEAECLTREDSFWDPNLQECQIMGIDTKSFLFVSQFIDWCEANQGVYEYCVPASQRPDCPWSNTPYCLGICHL